MIAINYSTIIIIIIIDIIIIILLLFDLDIWFIEHQGGVMMCSTIVRIYNNYAKVYTHK